MHRPTPIIRRIAGGSFLLMLAAACAEPTSPVASARQAARAASARVRPIHWQRAAEMVHGRVLLAAPDGMLYAGDEESALFRSADEGRTWTPLAGYPAEHGVLSLAVGEKGELYAGTANGVYRAADGEKWESLGLEGYYVTAIGRTGRGTLFAAATGFAGGVFRHDQDEYGNWQWTVVLPSMNPREFIPTYLAIAPNSDLVLGTRVDGEWLTGSGGELWTYLHYDGAPSFVPPITDMEFTSDGAMLAAWNDGLLRSRDGGSTWIPVLGGVQIEHLTTAPDGSIYAASILGSAYRSLDGGQSWTLVAVARRGMEVRELAVTASGRMLASDWEGLWASTRD